MTFHSIPNCFWKVMSSSHVPVTTILFIYIYLMVKYTIKTGNVPIGWSSCSPSPPWDLAWQKLPGGACELPGDDEVRRWHEDTWFRQGKSSGFFWGKSRGTEVFLRKNLEEARINLEETKKSVFWSMIGSFYWRCYLKESERKMGREARMLEIWERRSNSKRYLRNIWRVWKGRSNMGFLHWDSLNMWEFTIAKIHDDNIVILIMLWLLHSHWITTGTNYQAQNRWCGNAGVTKMV